MRRSCEEARPGGTRRAAHSASGEPCVPRGAKGGAATHLGSSCMGRSSADWPDCPTPAKRAISSSPTARFPAAPALDSATVVPEDAAFTA